MTKLYKKIMQLEECVSNFEELISEMEFFGDENVVEVYADLASVESELAELRQQWELETKNEEYSLCYSC